MEQIEPFVVEDIEREYWTTMAFNKPGVGSRVPASTVYKKCIGDEVEHGNRGGPGASTE